MKTQNILVAIIFLLLSFQVNAQTSLDVSQVPGCKGTWLFDFPEAIWNDFTSGGPALVPFGTAPTLIAGPMDGDGAIALPENLPGNYVDMKVNLTANGGEGATKVNVYTLIFDVRISNSIWKSLFSNLPNVADGDGTLWIRTTNNIGAGALGTLTPTGSNTGYTSAKLNMNEWYRVAFVCEGGTSFKIYFDGVLVATKTGGPALDSQFALNAGNVTTHLFGDNDGDNGSFDCAAIAIWDKALTDLEIATLGTLHGPIETPPVAAFKGLPVTLNEGGVVNYTDQSSNTPTSWAWTFEGGTPATSTLQNPKVRYSKAGTYSVSLIATNEIGSSEVLSKPNFITVTTGGPTVTCDKASYTTNEDIIVNFTGSTATKDWIGVYKSINVPGEVNSIIWDYVNGTDGAITFTSGLSEIGDYTAYLCANDGYDVIASVNFSVVNSTGLVSVDNSMSSIKTFPNPTTGVFSLISAENTPAQITITSVDGGRIMSKKLDLTAKHIQTFDISDAPKGVYFISILSQQKSQTIKLIKK